MRTTVELDADAAAAIAELRRAKNLGMSEAVNELIRRGLLLPDERRPFHQATVALGLRLDVSNIGEALDVLEGPTAR
jgi:hypothetical protein